MGTTQLGILATFKGSVVRIRKLPAKLYINFGLNLATLIPKNAILYVLRPNTLFFRMTGVDPSPHKMTSPLIYVVYPWCVHSECALKQKQ